MSYEEDQKDLFDKFENGDVKLEAPKEFPEVNPEVYKDVEPLLFRGFLHVAAEINGVNFVFKSLNHHEFELLKLMVPTEDFTRKSLKKFYNHFLAHTVFMIEGVNTLTNREEMIPYAVKFFEEFDSNATSRLIRILSELNKRANRAVTLTEAYAMENVSRLRWAQFRGLDLTSTAVTGVQGTSRLGLNWAQLSWIAINRYEDLRETSEREWENAKFIASAMAGKGMNKVHNQDRRRRESERQERVERRDKILRTAILGETPVKSNIPGATLIAARTAEDLLEQYRRDLKGEKDWHDNYVASVMAQITETHQQRQQQLLDLQAQRDAENLPNVVGGTNMVGLSPDEVRARIHKRQQLQFEQANRAQSHAALFDDKVQAELKTHSEVPLIPTSTRAPGVPFKA